MWHAIVGSYSLDAPNWLPSGHRRTRAAKALCRQTGSGGRTWLVQFTRSLDSDLTCPVLDPVAGTHNPLWPFRQITLRMQSHGRAVSAVQDYLGQVTTGTYDLATSLAVTTWQVANGLAVTGQVTPPDWRAMGAYRTRGGHGFLLHRIVGAP
jgi:hypothetical protein